MKTERTNRALQTAILTGIISVFTAQSSAALVSHKKSNRILSGQLSGIVLSVDAKNSVCKYGELRFQNIATRKVFRGNFSSGENLFKRGSAARILTVPGGEYQIVSGQCRITRGNVKTIQPLKGLSQKFGTIMVRPGEVAYPGTFVFPNPRTQRRQSYSVYGNPQGAWQDISKFSGQLAPRFVERPIGMRRAAIGRAAMSRAAMGFGRR